MFIPENDMKLTLDTLKKTGAFTGRPVEKEIKWKGADGEEHIATTYVRPLGYHTATSDVLAGLGKIDGVAGRIAASICDEDGHQVFMQKMAGWRWIITLPKTPYDWSVWGEKTGCSSARIMVVSAVRHCTVLSGRAN